MNAEGVVPGGSRTPGTNRIVPVTELRHFYSLLRNTLQSAESHLAIAEELARVPARLVDLVTRSRTHFARYDNRAEAFRDGAGSMPFTQELLSSNREAHEFLRRVREGGVRVPTHPWLNAGYVDYELSPFRTTRSWFDTGVSGASTGRGGVDVILVTEQDRYPVVAEVKCDTDRNVFLGFVQAVTYAVELSTPSQRERLTRVYQGCFAPPTSGPWLDIYLLVVGNPGSRHHSTFVERVSQLSAALVAPGAVGGDFVRRVACLSTGTRDDRDTTFTVNFVHPASPTGGMNVLGPAERGSNG